MNIKDFNFTPDVHEGIEAMGFETATPIQELAIPLILEGKDLIASAQTGTGKTAAFLLPVINKIINGARKDVIKALILVPTRELAIQISQQMEGFSYFTPVSSIAIYGGNDGVSFNRERNALETGVDMVICTPGRLIAHLKMGYVNFDDLQYLILDEADRMLDIGFYEDIVKIDSYLPKKKQSLLFTATMPPKIRQLAKKLLHNPEEINIAISKPPEKIKQSAYIVYEKQKVGLIKYLFKQNPPESAIVFCSTKSNAKSLSRELKKNNIKCEEIHADLDQKAREEVMVQFRNKRTNVLVATDVIARGIDIEDIETIVNFDVPNNGEDYVHRIGRTARAEKEGQAITLVGEKDQNNFATIEHLLEKTVPKETVPPEFGDVPKYNPNQRRDGGRKKYYRKDKRKGKPRYGKTRNQRNRKKPDQ